jgi:hypothetical protein
VVLSLFGFVSNPGGNTSVTGTITAVSSGFASGPTGTTSLTVVTFVNSGSSITLYFCGDQHALFPINQTVRAEYSAGIACALLTRVVVMGVNVSIQRRLFTKNVQGI